MSSRSGSEAGYLAQTVHRLRLTQEELADRPAEERRHAMAEELETAMARVLPQQRRAFLDALLARFPAWDAPSEPRPSGSAPTRSPRGSDGSDDVSSLVEGLIEASKRMDDAQRASVRARLRGARLIDAADGSLRPGHDRAGALPDGRSAAAALTAARRALHLPADAPIDLGRLIAVMSKLLSFAERLDQAARQMRAELTAGSDNGPGQATDLRIECGRFVVSARKSSKIDLVDRIERSRRLIAALMGATERIAPGIQRIVDRLAPASIEAAAGRREGRGLGGLLHGKEALLWRTYREVAATFAGGAAEREIRDELAHYIQEYAPAGSPLQIDSDETTG